jgi:WD40 repeat protein
MVNFTQKTQLDFTIVKDYDQVHDNEIPSMVLTPNNTFLFTCDDLGSVGQISINYYEIFGRYDYVHDSEIVAVVCDSDSEFLYTACSDGYLKKFSIKERGVVKDYGIIVDNGIEALAI